MKHGNLEIIGTSHIAQQSVREIERAFAEPPAIVALELDHDRLMAMLHPEERQAGFWELSRAVGIRGAMFAVLGRWAQRQLGGQVGMEPGADMLRAFELAHECGARVALIDQPLEVTLRRFSQEVGFKEKAKMVWDVLKGLVDRREAEELAAQFDLRRVPQKKLIRNLLSRVRARYPGMYRVLVSERNEIMARRLAALCAQHHDERVLAVVGAGHEEEILRLIKRAEGGTSVSWSVSVDAQ